MCNLRQVKRLLVLPTISFHIVQLIVSNSLLNGNNFCWVDIAEIMPPKPVPQKQLVSNEATPPQLSPVIAKPVGETELQCATWNEDDISHWIDKYKLQAIATG